MMPQMIMMVGLPASGKSTKAQELAKEYNATIFSSDALRKELYGDENIQGDNTKLFNTLHQQIKTYLKNGYSTILDATNISYKKRMAFLSELKNIPCEKICVLMATPYEVCLERNAQRERKVPEYVIKRMYMNFNIPYWYEGWDDIKVIGKQCDHYNVDETVNALLKYNQGNPHHSLTLGNHLWKAYDYYFFHYADEDSDDVNSIATVLHDISKPFCRTSINSRGIDDGNIHYYNHQYTSAYDSLFINSTYNRLDIAIRIMWHMRPYLAWEQSDKAMQKDRKLLGENLFNDILKIHEADLAAH